VYRAGATLLLLAAIVPAHAQEDRICHDGHVEDEPLTLRPGVITGKQPRTYFHSGTDKRKDCPDAGQACRSTAYVVPGDKVIVAEEDSAPGFVCAAFVSRKGTVTAGWLSEKAVDIRPAAQPPITAWLGQWKYLNSNITIKRGKAAGSLDLEGDSWVKRYQSANEGAFSGEGVIPKGNTLAFADDVGKTIPIEKADKLSCALTFALIHDVMIVHDNGNCGGAGVYFTGFYRRKR
jgi:hypothetical protein